MDLGNVRAGAGLLLLLLLTRPAVASSLGVYFDPRGEESKAQVAAFQEFELYVVAKDIPEIWGFEFQMVVPRQMTVTDRRIGSDAAIDVGMGQDNYVVGTGICLTQPDPVLVTYTAMLFSDTDSAVVTLRESDPPSLGNTRPAYLTCDNDMYQFESVTGASINSEVRSWGRLKNDYGQ